MKFLAIILLTLNFWTGLFCCCLEQDCESTSACAVASSACGSEDSPDQHGNLHGTSMEMGHEDEDHQQAKGISNHSLRHGDQNLAEMAVTEKSSSWRISSRLDFAPKASLINLCSCDSHGKSLTAALTLPEAGQLQFSGPPLKTSVTYTTLKTFEPQTEPIFSAFIVSARWVPRLSVLARFII